MSDIVIRKNVKGDLKKDIPKLLNKAKSWVKKKYPDVDFSKTDFIFSGGYNRSRYFRNSFEDGRYQRPNTCICTRATLMLYEKKSLKMKKTSAFVGARVQIECAIVHELTHHAQYEEERSRSEVETTRNELEYLAENYPDQYEKFMK